VSGKKLSLAPVPAVKQLAEWKHCREGRGVTVDVKPSRSQKRTLTANEINHPAGQGQQAEGFILSLYWGQPWGPPRDIEELKRVQQKTMKATTDESTWPTRRD